MTTTPTLAQLTEAIKAYRAFGSKIRAEVKAGKPDLFIDRNRRFQKVIGGKLVDAEHMDLVLALADEQVALDGIAFAKAFPDQSGDTERHSRELLRSARQRIKAILSNVEADEALATLPTEVITELTGAEAPVAVSELHMRREYSGRVFRVLGVESGAVWLQALERSNEPIPRFAHELIEDLWIACEADGTPYEPDVSTMTLTDLVRFRRDCAETFNSPNRLDYASYTWAARFTEEIDQELSLREQTGLRAALILEATNIVAIEHGQRGDYEVPGYIAKELADVRLGIERHLATYGTLVRD